MMWYINNITEVYSVVGREYLIYDILYNVWFFISYTIQHILYCNFLLAYDSFLPT
jgi:hypothetical protein